MNVFFKSIALLIFVRASAFEVLNQSRNFETVENGTDWSQDGTPGDGNQGFGNKMNSTVYMSVNHYYCADEKFQDPVMILYGTKSWTFPTQDVNLTLSYPTANVAIKTTKTDVFNNDNPKAANFQSESEFPSDDHGYVITGFKVVLYVDGKETKGYIMEGGVLQESIALSFVSRYITSLSYEFWLYGIPKHTPGLTTELTTRYFVCK